MGREAARGGVGGAVSTSCLEIRHTLVDESILLLQLRHVLVGRVELLPDRVCSRLGIL